MRTEIMLDEQEQPWMTVRVCLECEPDRFPRRPFGLDRCCSGCGGAGERETRHVPQFRLGVQHEVLKEQHRSHRG
ncbi:hypothetical protein [Bounagaea algeriensis]